MNHWKVDRTRLGGSPSPTRPDVRHANAHVANPKTVKWPHISVVVCSYNGARTIRETLAGLLRLEYPTYEVIVVVDGSTDATASIVRGYGYRLVSTEHRGLSSARNTGMQVATGEIVAYIDDVAYPDPHWLTHLAVTFIDTHHAGVAGPNLAPGEPTHAHLFDRQMTHLPGSNMAFRKSTLQSIGGFDPRYRIAGDDVDVCWRLQQRGWTFGFQPAAVVWHHPCDSVHTYWNQQKAYGSAGVLLEEKWPQKYNEFGHLAWVGQHQDQESTQIDAPVPSRLWTLPLMPEWYLLISALMILAVLSVLWSPLLYSLPLLAIAISTPLAQAVWRTDTAELSTQTTSCTGRLQPRLFTAFLHGIQPIARIYGRLTHRFTRWRRHGRQSLALPWPRTISLWSETRQVSTKHLQSLEATLYNEAYWVKQNRGDDHWDLEVGGGLFGNVRTLMTVEPQSAGKQEIQFRIWPTWPIPSMATCMLFALLSVGAALDQAYLPATLLAGVAILATCRMFQECARAMSGVIKGITQLGQHPQG